MGDVVVTTLEDAYAAEGVTPPRAKRGRPEHALQTQIKKLVREFVALDHEFAAHDRSENRSGTQHMWEKARGARKGWPDIEIVLAGGGTFRCELKAKGRKPDLDQLNVIARLNALGHPTAWADSAATFVQEAARLGVPMRAGVERRALVIDAFLAEAEQTRAIGKRPSKPRREPAKQAGLRAVERARAKGTLV